MPMIATLTMNPAIDVAYAVPKVRHTHKVRTHGEHYDPGGGGINVARVVSRLGGTARAIYLAGGATGAALDGLVDFHAIARTRIPIRGHSRISTAIFEEESGKEYRFVPSGPVVEEAEWKACLSHLAGLSCDFIVMSGSLPQGVPGDFYARAGAAMAARGVRVVLDSSGEGLRLEALEGGGVHLVKPSLGELRALTGTAGGCGCHRASGSRDRARGQGPACCGIHGA
jgi:6-phosphofructokinase 2